MSTTYTVTAPTGAVLTRKSANRTYTHAIICRHNYAAALQGASKLNAMDKETFTWMVEMIAGTHDLAQRRGWETAEQHAAKRAHDVARYTADIAGATTADAYAELKRQERIAQVEAQRAAGHYDTFFARTWCGRPDLAQKEAARAQADGLLDVQAAAVTAKEAKPRAKKTALAAR